jgi:serine/threonine protein kinase
MTLQISTEQQCGNTSEVQCHRWPAHIAKNMAESIHQQVLDTLSQSRLVRKTDGIQFVRKDDIVRVENILGSGAFSQVSAVSCKDGRRYACKHLKQTLMSQPGNFRSAAAELACEAHMLASFDHPNILKIRGWAQNGVASFEDGWHNSFFLLLDVLDETLDQRIERWQIEAHNVLSALISQSTSSPSQHTSGLEDLWRTLSPVQCPLSSLAAEDRQLLIRVQHQSVFLEKIQTMTEIASALDYIHQKGVIFRDLKPNNIGFLGNRVQLFDFGLSRELPVLDTSVPFEMSGRVGTLRYMAPEVAMHQPYNLPSDVYSWAMVSYETLSLQKPFNGWTRDMHANLVCTRGVRPDTTNCIQAIPLEIRVLLEHAWHADPSQRPTVPQIGTQLELFREQQMLILRVEEQHLQRQISLHLEAQRLAQQEAEAAAVEAVAAMYEDMSYYLAPSSLQKIYRRQSSDSIGTIETRSLSENSLVL